MRINFKRPKTLPVDVSSIFPHSTSSLKSANDSSEAIPKDVRTKNWNIDTSGVTVNDVKESLIHNFNTKYREKYGKLPTRFELASRGFGKPSKKHCFTSDVTFDHTLIVLLKSGFLREEDTSNLLDCHPLYEHLHKNLAKAINVDFSDLNEPDMGYMDQTEIPPEKINKFLAATLFYDFHLASVMRYAGGNYTGKFRNVEYILSQIKGIAPDEIYNNVEKLLKIGAPHEINGHSTFENFMTYKNYGNHASILKKPEKIEKVMNKEHRYDYAIALPSWIARFIPNMHLTPQGLVIKPGKNDRLVFDASIRLQWDSFCVNMSTDPKTAPPIYYGLKFKMHLNRIWNLRISYPSESILLWDDDVAGAFRQGKYNPEVAAAFCFIIFGRLWLPCGMTFGGNTSPQCYEPLANAREYLAEHLSNEKHSFLVEKHWNLIKNVPIELEGARQGKPVQARRCHKCKGVINEKTGEPENTPHNTFVDDNHMAELRTRMYQAMAASIESLYRTFGFPEEKYRRISLSLDKYFQAECSTRKQQLGLIVDSHEMVVELPLDKRTKIAEKLVIGIKRDVVSLSFKQLNYLEYLNIQLP